MAVNLHFGKKNSAHIPMNTTPPDSAVQPDPFEFWGAMRGRWGELPSGLRRSLLLAGAAELHLRWREGAMVSHLTLDMLAWRPRLSTGPEVRLPALPGRGHPEPWRALMETVARWWGEAEGVLSRAELARFLSALMAHEGLEPSSWRTAMAELVRQRARLDRAGCRSAYRGYLDAPPVDRRAALQALWRPDPGLSPHLLNQSLVSLERDGRTRWLKGNPDGGVFRARLLGREVVVKVWAVNALPKRCRYLWRASHGRRAFAAGRTLLQEGLPTPEPLAFLERRHHGLTTRSYFVSAFMEESQSVRAWLDERASLPYPAVPGALWSEIVDHWLQLLDVGIYHRDVKSLNLLMKGEGAHRQLFWIDLECARFGGQVRRIDILRNLVQLQASLPPVFREEGGEALFARAALRYPWLLGRGARRVARRWIAWRLYRERRGWANP